MPRIAKKSGAYHHGDLRRALLDAAIQVVDKDGPSALSLLAIAKRAGVSSGAPYHHFANREELLAAIGAEGFALLTDTMRRTAAETKPLRGETPSETHLRGLGRGYVRFALAHPGHFRLMFRPESKRALRERSDGTVDEAFTMISSAIVRCQEEGSIPKGDPKTFVLLGWSIVHGASTLWIDGPLASEGLLTDEDALPEVADAFLDLLRRGKPGG